MSSTTRICSSTFARHRLLLELVESGDRDAALAELAVHGEGSFEKLQAMRPGSGRAAARLAADG